MIHKAAKRFLYFRRSWGTDIMSIRACASNRYGGAKNRRDSVEPRAKYYRIINHEMTLGAMLGTERIIDMVRG